MTEEQLLAGCILNQAHAQEAFYRKFSPKMFGVCFRYARNRQDAEDMLQEGFIKVFSQIHQFRGEGSIEGWVRIIIVHTCINFLKKNKKFSECLDIVHAENVIIREDMIPSVLHARQIVDCIRMLPLGYRTVLNLYAIEGYSHREIAQMLDIEESTSRSQYTRARTMLEKILLKRKIISKGSENKRLSAAGFY